MNSFYVISLNYGKSKILINNCCKYLGILVDSNLNFAFQIKSTENKAARSIRIISKLIHLLPTKTLLLQRNAAAGESCWQQCVRFYRSEILTSNLPLQDKQVTARPTSQFYFAYILLQVRQQSAPKVVSYIYTVTIKFEISLRLQTKLSNK